MPNWQTCYTWLERGFTSDFDAVLDRLIELLIEDGLDRDQIHLFLDTLLYIEHLPN